MMKRRAFLKSMGYGIAASCAPAALYAAPEDYTGRLLVILQADGGWDVTSFCDPKDNVPGELEINQWARSNDIQTAGNISYAPFANNQTFFERNHQNMLVINGVDAQTNSHTTGVLHNWSGRNAEGYPSLSAMFAAQQAPGLPLSYVNFGGFADTARLIRYNRLDDVFALRTLVDPRIDAWDNQYSRRSESDMARIREYQAAKLQRQLGNTKLMSQHRDNLEAYQSALANKEALRGFNEFLPAEEEFTPDSEIAGQFYSSLFRQIELTVVAFKAGMASASDLILSGFDTHTDHEQLHGPLLTHMNDAIDHLWTQADIHGVADRITLVVGSDFGRTPHFNNDNGKDHWPIGSVIVMEKNAGWGNRVVGLTDGGHNAHLINPTTLQRDDSGGTIIYPKHIHKALRRYLGLENTSTDANFRFENTEDFDFFNPSLSTT